MADTLTITYLSGSSNGESISCASSQIVTIGRDKSNHIVFDGPDNSMVSREHAVIQQREQDGEWVLIDKSTNGTMVNGQKRKNEMVVITNGDIMSFAKDRKDMKIEIADSIRQVNHNASEMLHTTPSYTKIVPTARAGFLADTLSQPFFIPGVFTVIIGVLLFVLLFAGLDEPELAYFSYYQNILGIYLGAMMLFFVRAVSGANIPIWFILAIFLFTVFIIVIEIPFALLSIIFRPYVIESYMGSDLFFQQLLGHFVGSGLLEELFKSIPLWLIILLGPNLSNLNLPGFIKKKVNPTIAILIGTASAVAFIVIETLGQYVPDIDDPYDLAYGLMLLIPRFITGLAGHVSWSGIFAYFIALGFYYKKVNMIYPLIGWFLASILHGLWNSVIDFSILMGFAVSVGTFIIFMVFLLKAKKSFPI